MSHRALVLALLLSCRGPDLEIAGESVRARLGDAVLGDSPWLEGKIVHLVAAKNEVLGLQIFHRGPIALHLDHTVAYDVESYRVTRPSTALYGGSQGPGLYPDGLVATASPTSDPAYFEVTAVVSTRGTLEVSGRTIPVALEVVPVELPPLPLSVWAYENPREPGADERACIDRFATYGVLLSPDLTPADYAARRDLFSRSPYLPALLPADPTGAAEAVRAFVDLKPQQTPFAIPIDEPRTAADRARVRAIGEAVHGVTKDFLMAVTDFPRPEYGDAVDLYISPRAAHLGGDTVRRWTYNGRPPEAGAMVLDAESPGLRTWGWIAWRWNIPVWYVWDALYWHDRHNRRGALDVRASTISFDDGEDHGNLDGVLALPGCRPTLRLAALRRGLLDRQLLELAARCHPDETAALAARMVPRALGDASGAASWPRDEVAWERARRELLGLAACR